MKTLEAMFESSRAAALTVKPMSLRWATMMVVIISGIVLLYAAVGIHYILTGHKHLALLYCGLAAFILMTLPIHVYNFLRVKKGIRVVVPNPLFVFGWLRVPLSVKVALVGSLTLLVAAVSYLSLSPLHFSFRLVSHNHAAFNLLIVVAGFNLFLWVVVGFAWYLFVIQHEQKPVEASSAVEHGKDIWPPAPLMADQFNED